MPSFIVPLDKLPLNANGKVDRKALPDPDVSKMQQEYVASSTETETVLAGIWEKLLGVERVGLNDNFFHLGGHSLLAIQLTGKLQAKGWQVTARQVFSDPTLGALAKHVRPYRADYAVPENPITAKTVEITPDMLPLVEQISEPQLERLIDRIPGGVPNIQDVYPLAPLQEGMLFHNRMQAGARDPYVLSNILSFGTKGKRDRFVAALQAIVDRHDVLRTSFHWEGLPAPLQVVQRKATLQVTSLPIDRTPEETLKEALQRSVYVDGSISMDLGRAPLMNIHKVEGPSSDKCHIVLSWHHMVMDHVGMEQITREVISFYKGSFDDLPSPVPYREFVGRLQHIRANTDYLSHFRDRFSHVDTPTLAYGVTDVNIDGKNVQERKRAISIEQSRRIRRCCKAHNISPAALFHAAWGLVVGRTSGENSVVFGTVLFGRTESADSLQSLGLYINTLPIALRLEGTVKDYLERVYEELSILVNYEQVNLAEIKGLTRLKDGNVPLFNTLINYRYSLMDAESEDDALFERMGISVVGSQERTNYPLSLSVDDFGETFALSVQIADELKVGTETILDYTQRAIGELTDVLETGSSVSVGEVGILPNREIELLDSWNRTEVEYPAETCIHQLFENQAEKRPDATALVFQDESMSYRQLNERANQLAHCLREERKVGPDTLVGICLDRSLEMIVSILAILKAGGAYLPLDPDYPVSRLEYMAKDAGLRTVVTTKRLKEKLDGVLGKDATIDIESEDGKLSGYPKTNIPAEVSGLTSSNLAYVIYTSGSTGRPKGVMVEHRSVTALVKNVDYVQLDSNSVLLQNATISFDAATFEIWGALLNGGRTVINPNRVTDISGLEQIIEKNDVNTVFLTTALFNQFATETVDERLRSIKQLYTGGELHNSQIIESYLGQHENTSLYNIYGVTECTTFSSVKLLSKEEVSQGSQLPIGKPISNTSLYVLDVNRQRVPVGVAGELYIGGAGVARGYLNRPELTAERFVENTFGDDPNDRLYRTGDLVKYLPDGNLVFLGRMDHQVKLRGFRIELGEIENVLSGNGTVQNAVATLHNNEHLVAYVAVGDTDKLAENFNAELLEYAKGLLPEYMVPSFIVPLDKLPLNANGKVDRKALPDPDVSKMQQEYVAPSTETETVLAGIWEKLLGVERVGLNDNFFHLGGHSLLAIQLIGKLQAKGWQVTARQVFSDPTLGALAKHVRPYRADYAVPENPITAKTVEITPDMLPLVEQISEPQLERLIDRIPGGVPNIQDVYPLAPLQEGMLFHNRMQAGARDPYVLSNILSFGTKGKRDRFVAALQAIVDRHDVLRTSFHWEGLPAPLQVVQRKATLQVTSLPIDRTPEETLEEALQRSVYVDGSISMDLGRAPLMNIHKVEGPSSDKCHIVLSSHHMVMDHVGMEQITREVISFYKGSFDDLPSPVPYREFVGRLQHIRANTDYLSHFRDRFSHVDTPTLAYGVTDVNIDGKNVQERKRAISIEQSRRIRRCCKAHNISPAALFHAAWGLVVGRTSGENSVVFGTVLFGRTESADSLQSLGLYINTLPIALRLEGTVKDYLERVYEELSILVDYEQVPLAEIKGLTRLKDGNVPLFNTLINYRYSLMDAESEDDALFV